MPRLPLTRLIVAHATPLILILGACDGPQRDVEPARGSDAQLPVAAPTTTAMPVPESFSPTALKLIPRTSFVPMFRGKDGEESITVASFMIEEHPVTNDQFVAFLRANPEWRRSQVPSIFAQEGYLHDWSGDLQPPGRSDAGPDQRPVTGVSWFAARAYARWLGRRLPTVAEWELVGGASADAADSSGDAAHTARILEWYSRPRRDPNATVRSTMANVHGVWDMHGLVWEWTEDFNSALVTGESRGDTSLADNLFCGGGALGATDPTNYAAFMRTAFRSSMRGNFAVRNVGFRCATDIE